LEYFYGFLAGEASQYEPTLARNTRYVETPHTSGGHDYGPLPEDIDGDVKKLEELKALSLAESAKAPRKMSPEAEKPRIVHLVTVHESKGRNHESKEHEPKEKEHEPKEIVEVLLPLFVSIRTNWWFSLPPIRGTVTSLLQLVLAPWRFF